MTLGTLPTLAQLSIISTPSSVWTLAFQLSCFLVPQGDSRPPRGYSDPYEMTVLASLHLALTGGSLPVLEALWTWP